MKTNQTRATGWGTIIAIMVGVGVATGLLLGLLGTQLGLSSRWTTTGVGAAVGAVGALLIVRRRAALAREKQQ